MFIKYFLMEILKQKNKIIKFHSILIKYMCSNFIHLNYLNEIKVNKKFNM